MTELTKEQKNELGGRVNEHLILLEALEESGTQIAGLKTLCLRAADALEQSSPLIGAEDATDELIVELRKAAQ